MSMRTRAIAVLVLGCGAAECALATCQLGKFDLPVAIAPRATIIEQ
jgi:hypothetical protein